MEKEPQLFSPERGRSLEGIERIFKYYKGEAHAHSLDSMRSAIGGKDEKGVHRDSRLLQYAEKLGLDFVVFSEHSSSPANPKELDEDDEICQAILREQEKIKELNEQGYGSKAYSAVEANIFFNGEGEAVIDVPDSVLEKKDLVIASRHQIDGQRDPEKIKESLLAAVNNQNVDVIGHPYRHIEFYPHDFNYFKKYYREKDPEIYSALEKMEADKEWDKIKKIIGKNEIEEGENDLKDLNEKFMELEGEYWGAWDEILDAMEKEGKAFEINLKVFIPTKSFYIKILQEAAKRPNLRFSVVFDFHNLGQVKNFKEKDFKSEALPGAKSPAQVNARRRMLDLVNLLEEIGIGPDRIINSSDENFFRFIEERN